LRGNERQLEQTLETRGGPQGREPRAETVADVPERRA